MNVFAEVIQLVLSHTVWELGMLCLKLCISTLIACAAVLVIIGIIGITLKIGQVFFGKLDHRHYNNRHVNRSPLDTRDRVVYDR